MTSQPMGIPRVCVSYGTRTRFATTNAPYIFHYSMGPNKIDSNLGEITVKE